MSRCIVLRGVRPQTRRVCVAPGVRSGVLVDGEPVTVFDSRRQARRAVKRTEQAARALLSAVVDVASKLRDNPDFASLFSPEPFTVVDVVLLAASGVPVANTPEPTSDKETRLPDLSTRAAPLPLFSAVDSMDAAAGSSSVDYWSKAGVPSPELYPVGHSRAPSLRF